ncbi:MAG TPA: outer membrane beta-barrel protein [Candidatus Angelobacter sp.]|nr:outer membrane beta-barrel protein [Candidatus Angelobacter sp.]
MQTTLANTTISGYVDTAVQYNAGNQAQTSVQPIGTFPGKVDNFSLNDIDIAIDKPVDSTPWAAGYHADFNLGTDAQGWTGLGNGTAGTAVRQAYVALSTPVGNGITWKMGIQDDIIGYEGNTDGANPNYTRSIAWNLEPATLLGLVGSYQINSLISIQAGIANATQLGQTNLSSKAFVGAIALTAPDSWGFLKGGTANVGIVANPEKYGQYNYYAGFTIPTPINILKVGGAFDLVSINNSGTGNPGSDSGWVLGGYANVQATDKLALNLRGEVYDLKGTSASLTPGLPGGINPISSYGNSADGVGEEFTATVQYNLWANVISRVEFRWDHEDVRPYSFGVSSSPVQDSFILALNIIYTF